MVAPNARGGIRSVVEAYSRDGFLLQENVRVIHSYGEGGVLKRQFILLQALLAYVWFLITTHVELVHVHAAMRGSFWRKAIFSAIARLFGRPVILHLHGSEMKLFYAAQKPFAKSLIRRELERTDCVVVLSGSWADFVSQVAPRAKIAVVPNYVVVTDADTSVDELRPTALFLGLIGERKGTFDLISAFAEVHRCHPGARLVIGGNGETKRARTLIENLGLNDVVQMAGWVDDQRKRRLLAASSIYVLPSYNEGLPMSVLEAMAAGIATITTRVGGIPELITDDVDGVLINPGDIKSLSERINDLLSNPERRVRIAKSGQERVRNAYSKEIVLERLHYIYKNAAYRP